MGSRGNADIGVGFAVFGDVWRIGSSKVGFAGSEGRGRY